MMRVLSIDPATKTGWVSPSASGVVDFKLRSNESKGMKFVKFRAYIKDLIIKDDINLVAWEKPGGRHYNGIRSHANFEGVLMELCEELNIQYKDYSATEIKAFAKKTWMEVSSKKIGRMTKELMEQTAIAYFEELDIIDDNHADALWLNELVKIELGYE